MIKKKKRTTFNINLLKNATMNGVINETNCIITAEVRDAAFFFFYFVDKSKTNMIELLTCVLNIVLRVKMRHKNQSHLFNNTALLNRFKTGYAKKRNGIVVTITNVMFEIPFMTEKYRETTVYKPQLACPFSAQNSTHF